MNVFVLCTGRCGSLTFVRACEHITNYTAGHETRCRHVGPDRLAYPGNHIEADNRLSWFLGRLDATFGDDAFYIHLIRDPAATANSFNSRWALGPSIVRAYRDSVLMLPTDDYDTMAICRDYVATVTANIEHFLKDKSHWMTFRLESATEDFPTFWDRIGAEGAFDDAIEEWHSQYNPPPRPPPSLPYRITRRVARSVGLRLP